MSAFVAYRDEETVAPVGLFAQEQENNLKSEVNEGVDDEKTTNVLVIPSFPEARTWRLTAAPNPLSLVWLTLARRIWSGFSATISDGHCAIPIK
jgi:hypothetical protein